MMKKLLKIAIYVMAVIVGVYYGLAFIGALMNGSEGIAYMLDLLLGLFLAYNVGIIVHEGGHLIFGLMAGYRFCSFRVWSLMLIRQNGRIRFRRFKLMGTGGQCLMIPPEREETGAQVILYNLGGVIANLIFAVICGILYAVLPKIYLLSTFLWMSVAFSLITLLTNGIPLNLGGIANDGMNALHLSKNPDAAEAFRKTLMINASQTEGNKVSDMPAEWFTLSDGADMQNVHCASLAVFATGRTLDRGDTLKAEEEISTLLNSRYNIIGLHRNLLTCDLISCRLINDPSADISSLITPELNKIMKAMRNYPSVIRTQYIIALLYEKDEKKAADIAAIFARQTKNFPYRQEVESELALINRAYEKSRN